MSDKVCTGDDLHTLDSVHEKALKYNIPLQVYVELTYSCNERCVFCYNPADRISGLTYSQLRPALEEIAAMGGFYLNLTGGEPLLHPEFFAIARLGADLGFSLRLFTNATLITPDNIDKICAIPFTGFDISIHGASPETHDRITSLPGSFEKMIRAVRLLRERGMRVVLKMPITRHNQHEYAEVEKIANQLGCELKSGSHMTPTNDFRQEPLSYTPHHEFLEAHYRNAFLGSGGRVLYVQEYNKKAPNCTLGRSIMGIAPNGDIYPCIQMPVRLGNILIDSVKEVWHDETRMAPYRSIVRSELSPCKTCKISSYCSFCPGIAYLQHRNLKRAHLEACLDAAGSYHTYQFMVADEYMRARES